MSKKFKKDYLSLIKLIKDLYKNEEKIFLHRPVFFGNEKKYILEAIESTFVSSAGEFVNQFENEFSNLTNCKYSIATSSGTSALHISLYCLAVYKILKL